jgi:hypothetical protein
MAEKVEVEMGGQSRHKVAHRMADVSREDYLRAVVQAVDALNGIAPS